MHEKIIDYRIAAVPDERVPEKITGTFAQGDKNLSSVFADINEQIADGAFSIPLLKDNCAE
ncbi:MAG: hypothetical protein ACLTDX_05115 [[Clostridium] innocuum]